MLCFAKILWNISHGGLKNQSYNQHYHIIVSIKRKHTSTHKHTHVSMKSLEAQQVFLTSVSVRFHRC